MAASTTPASNCRDHCVVVPASPTYVERPADLGGAQRLAVFAVDFSRESGRSFVDAVPACARAAELRPRGPAEPSGAGADQQRIAAVFYELRPQPPDLAALHGGVVAPGPPAKRRRRR